MNHTVRASCDGLASSFHAVVAADGAEACDFDFARLFFRKDLTMTFGINDVGGVTHDLAAEVTRCWLNAAAKSGVDTSNFAPDASLDRRIAWASRQGLENGCIYTRFSSKHQHSTGDQVRTCFEHAASKGIYCPPEFICADEGTSGCRSRRDGLERLIRLLQSGLVCVLLVFKVSRLFRQAFKGYQLIQQEVVEEGLRAISVTQGIDTADTRAWKMLFQVHGMVDEMLLEATADHVRAGLKGLFARGYVTGAIPVGYRREELPDAPKTNHGLPRYGPAVDPQVAETIRSHFELIRDGMPIRKAWQMWVANGGPADPRSTTGKMTYSAYRRMLSRLGYTGRWEFGRKRNEFSTKRDYAKQVEQPDEQVEKFECVELRIIDDELFFAVQHRLAELKTGPRGPRPEKPPQLWDLVTDLFFCASCDERFYQSGARGQGMQCKNGALCPCLSAIKRQDAVRAICEKLGELIGQDAELIEQVICCAREVDAQGDEQLQSAMAVLQKQIAGLTRKISDLHDLAGQGDDEDRKETMARVRAAQAERATARRELTQIERRLQKADAIISPEQVGEVLSEFSQLLEEAASGELGNEAVYKAVSVFRSLVGERVWVHVEPRPNRKQKNARGVFRPDVLNSVRDALGLLPVHGADESHEVTVWLRKPPRLDAIAERVHELVDGEGLSYRDAAKQLRKEGYQVNSGNVWYSYRRYYEMMGKPLPEMAYNNGHQRCSR